MTKPQEFYDLLLDYAQAPAPIEEVIIGLVWTFCRAEDTGLCMSPGSYTRTLPWAGAVKGMRLAQVANWVREFDPYRAAIGMAAVNAALSSLGARPDGCRLEPDPNAASNLAVFQHFLPQLHDQNVVVIGRYPGLHEFASSHGLRLSILERDLGPGDLPDTAAEFLLPEADWVFLTSSSIANKTFPRLAELARPATTVLMGPTTPWLPDLCHFGIDYLAGIDVLSPDLLRTVIAEGGGVRIFDAAVRYRVVSLTPDVSRNWTRDLITRTVTDKASLTQDMEHWYANGRIQRYPEYDKLEGVQRRLSRLDACFKTLWDSGTERDGEYEGE